MKWVYGDELHPADQRSVLAGYVHRYTGDHTPKWVIDSGNVYKPQFRNDRDWLANTEFAVKKDGRLNRTARYCRSHPTWPFGK